MFRHMPDFNRDIVSAGNNHNAFGHVYLFTNENVADYINRFDMRGKRILSVAAGGDHAFECLLSGASFVDMFDVNYAQKVIVELKSHMIKSLPYEDFMDFFFDKKHFFDKKIIAPLWKNFSRELSLYMDWYYCMGECAPRRMFVYGKSMNPGYDKDKISYLSCSEKYAELSNRIPRVFNFAHRNISDLAGYYNQKYDFILLSNIFDYYRCPMFGGPMVFNQFYDNVIKRLSEKNLVQKDGYIMLDYLWDTKSSILTDWYQFAKKFNKAKKDVGQKMGLISVVSPIVPSDRENLIMYMTQNIKTK